jgi:hypothetical protein
MRPWFLSGPSLPTPHSWAPLRLGYLKEVGQLAARHFNDANNARRDLGYPHPARVARGEEELDGLGAEHLNRSSKHLHVIHEFWKNIICS